MQQHTITFDADRFQLVPKEPTPEMLLKGCEAGLSNAALFDDTRFACELAVWKAMLATAPTLMGGPKDTDWQRIDTAPKDETKILLRWADPSGVSPTTIIASWNSHGGEDGAWMYEDGMELFMGLPAEGRRKALPSVRLIGWMPVPPPPPWQDFVQFTPETPK